MLTVGDVIECTGLAGGREARLDSPRCTVAPVDISAAGNTAPAAIRPSRTGYRTMQIRYIRRSNPAGQSGAYDHAGLARAMFAPMTSAVLRTPRDPWGSFYAFSHYRYEGAAWVHVACIGVTGRVEHGGDARLYAGDTVEALVARTY